MRHHRLATSAKERKDIVDQPPLNRLSRNDRGKDMEIAHLFHTAHDVLSFDPIHRRLDGCIRRPTLSWERINDVANRTLTFGPQNLHDLKFEIRQFRREHPISYWRRKHYYRNSRKSRAGCGRFGSNGISSHFLPVVGSCEKQPQILRLAALAQDDSCLGARSFCGSDPKNASTSVMVLVR